MLNLNRNVPHIKEEPQKANIYTGIGNSVAIVTDGTAILGLGDIGPVAGMPVMEGKAALFDQLAEYKYSLFAALL